MSNILWSKVKFVRNLKGVKFEPNISELEQKEVSKLCLNTINECGLKGGSLSEISDSVVNNLLANELIEQDFVTQYTNTAFANDGNVTVQINGKNHIEIIAKDRDIFSAYKQAKDLDKRLCNKLHFAYSDKYGFLGPDIKDVGSGLKIQVKAILPALVKIEAIKKLPKANEKLIFNIDCIDHKSGLCVIPTTTTLGYNEKQICELVYSYINKIIKLEIDASKSLAQDIDDVKDKCERAKAILNNCIKTTIDEVYMLLGNILIAINSDVENEIKSEQINNIINCIKLNKNSKILASEIQKILKNN